MSETNNVNPNNIDYMEELIEKRKTNYLVRATADNGNVRIIIADTRGIVKESARLHGTSPLATVALGRALTAVAMMGQMQKSENDTISLQFRGDGPIGGITVISDAKSNVRGYVNHPTIELPLKENGHFDVGSAVGQGTMYVIKDMHLKEPYVGQSEIISGEIGVDLTYYFANSEQTPSVVAVGVSTTPEGEILFSGGYIIQLMPGAEEPIINYIENTINHIPSVTGMMASGETIESMLDLIFGEKDLQILETLSCDYKCNCSRERMERGLISLGKDDLKEMIDDIKRNGKPIECHCHFCQTNYYFNSKDLEQLLKSASEN